MCLDLLHSPISPPLPSTLPLNDGDHFNESWRHLRKTDAHLSCTRCCVHFISMALIVVDNSYHVGDLNIDTYLASMTPSVLVMSPCLNETTLRASIANGQYTLNVSSTFCIVCETRTSMIHVTRYASHVLNCGSVRHSHSFRSIIIVLPRVGLHTSRLHPAPASNWPTV